MKLIKDEDNTDELIERIEKLRGTKMRFGILGSGLGGEKHKDTEISVVHIGSIHEFGHAPSGIPERSFMRKTFDDKKGEIAEIIEQHGGDYVAGDISYDVATKAIGEFIKGLIQKTIVEVKTPPLKQATIDAKESSQPLIDKGQLLDSIEYEVV